MAEPKLTICSKCEKNPRAQSGKQRWCLPCRNAWNKINRKKHCQLSLAEKKKSNCRAYANVYQRRGKLKPKPCSVKGCKEKAQKHHPDYSKPLKVKWLCRKHHLLIHKI